MNSRLTQKILIVKINYHIRRGILVNTARTQMEVMNNAEKGNTQAIQLLSKIQYRKNFETARRDILYDCEIDEKILHRLEAYIESGSTIKLKPGEEPLPGSNDID